MFGADLSNRLWILKTNKSFEIENGGAVMVLQSLEDLLVAQAVKFSFKISNNEAKYEDVLLGFHVARALTIRSLKLHFDSYLVAS